MQNSTLKNILIEYDKKRTYAEAELEEKKKILFDNNPELKNIIDTLNNLYLEKSKIILLNNTKKKLDIINKKIMDLKNKKNIILKNLNLNESDFIPNYSCKMCNDTGFIQNENGLSSMCSCLKQKIFDINYNKCNIGNLDKENFETFNDNLYSDEINIEKYNSKVSPRENIKNIKKICNNFINNFDNADEKNLLFTGNTGLRKNISF